MATMEDTKDVEAVTQVKQGATVRTKHFVKVGESLAKVLQWNEAGDELIFEHEKGRFMALSDSDRQKLSHDNKVRYSMSVQLNAAHDPENDAIQNRLKVVGANERRKEFEATVKTTSQGMRATKKLQAFVGEGYEPFWTRQDKIEDRLERGYQIVKPDTDVYAGVSATDGHFETRVKPGETELVLMRISKEQKGKNDEIKRQVAERQDKASEKVGESQLRAMGATLVGNDQGSNWADR